MLLPGSVELCEVGPRDGFQFEEKAIPTDLKIEIISGLVRAGVRRIQVTSFVHPKRVPQMADAEDVIARLPTTPAITYSALALNQKGVERAILSGVKSVDISIATNEKHGRDNANMTVQEGVTNALAMIEHATRAGISTQIGLQTVFGYGSPGDTSLDLVASLVERFCEYDVESVSLADSTGVANPVLIEKVLERIRPVAGVVPIVLHLHDTRGLGMANVVAAMRSGINRFDTSLGGMGGCPFIPGATGNIATEDTVYLLDSMGVETGIDAGTVAALTRTLVEYRGRPLPGKMYGLTR